MNETMFYHSRISVNKSDVRKMRNKNIKPYDFKDLMIEKSKSDFLGELG